jgi:hypothetical protein
MLARGDPALRVRVKAGARFRSCMMRGVASCITQEAVDPQ